MTGSGDNVNGVNSLDYSNLKPPSNGNSNGSSVHKSGTETRFYPNEIAHDLDGIPTLSENFIHEALATSWEYARCVIPSYSNWDRYVAFMRTVTIGIIAEVDSTLVDVVSDDFRCGGYTLDEILDTLFARTPAEEAGIARDYRTFLATTAEKTGDRKNSHLFHRYVSSLPESPRSWFRIRDADALIRFTAASALVCNDMLSPSVWFTPGQWEIIGELACTLYDAVAFYKHRAEGEVNNTFAYAPWELRKEAFRMAREVLWGLDTVWGVPGKENGRVEVVNFIRLIGGPIHLMMRRYRFVEEGLMVGKEEDEEVVSQTKKHVKLWNRVEIQLTEEGGNEITEDETLNGIENRKVRYMHVIRNKDRLLFDGLAELLELQMPDRVRCSDCNYRSSYGSEGLGQFGGVQLCRECKEGWRVWIESLPRRAAEAFPELRETRLTID
ncbi:hypothetical protein V8F06_008187 [Rhypophila decipiens]